MTFHTTNAFDIVCRLDRDDILDEVPQNEKQKVATGLFLDLGLFPFEPRKSWDRSVVIVLLTSCPT